MNKFFKVILGVVMLAIIVVLGSSISAHAMTRIEEGAEEKCDLNGDGKKETISFASISENYNVEWFELYVNGKALYTYDSQLEGSYYTTYVYIYDIDPSDKYKEIVIDFDDEFDHTFYVYRYNGKKLKLLFKEEYALWEFRLVSEQKKGKKVLMQDPITCALGNHIHIIRNYKIKNKKLVEVTPKSNTYIVPEKDEFGFERDWYTAAKNITVYKSSDGKKAVSTLKKGTEFTITKIKFVNDEAKYALINIKGGKKSAGWINIEYYSGCTWEDKLIENPGFAG